MRANYEARVKRGEPQEEHIFSVSEDKMKGSLPTFDPSNLVGRTYVEMPQDDGTQRRVTIEKVKPECKDALDAAKDIYRFKCRVGVDTFRASSNYGP